YALIQTRSQVELRARIIASNNILNALFMVVGALAAGALLSSGLSIPALFGVAAVCNAAVAIYIYKLVPEFLLRFVVWMLIHTVYRLEKRGIEHIPDEGAAVLVCNHVSFVDALIIAAACRRPVRFVMDHRIFRWPLLSFVFRAGRAIPIASEKEDAALKARAFDEVSLALAAGELVCIFPEGNVTASGEMQPFRPGVTQIITRDPVPVIPMALSGLWGSIFSREGGGVLSNPWKARPFRKIGLQIAAPVASADATLKGLQDIVANLRGAVR
ncbi:MAG: 1-acyl-sn-glycerol-3-phosphate acyltransferase, partial [Gallionella sp.]